MYLGILAPTLYPFNTNHDLLYATTKNLMPWRRAAAWKLIQDNGGDTALEYNPVLAITFVPYRTVF